MPSPREAGHGGGDPTNSGKLRLHTPWKLRVATPDLRGRPGVAGERPGAHAERRHGGPSDRRPRSKLRRWHRCPSDVGRNFRATLRAGLRAVPNPRSTSKSAAPELTLNGGPSCKRRRAASTGSIQVRPGVEVGSSIGGTSGVCRPNFPRAWRGPEHPSRASVNAALKMCKVRSISNSAWPVPGQVWPTSAQSVVESGPSFAASAPPPVKVCPSLRSIHKARSGGHRVQIGRLRAKHGRTRPTFGRSPTKLARERARSAQFCSNIPNLRLVIRPHYGRSRPDFGPFLARIGRLRRQNKVVRSPRQWPGERAAPGSSDHDL